MEASAKIRLTGYLEELLGSKRGLRFVQMGVMEPYVHSVIIHIAGDDDDVLNAALFPLWNRRIDAALTEDQFGDLYTTADQITLCDRDAALRGREAAEAEGQQPGPTGIAHPVSSSQSQRDGDKHDGALTAKAGQDHG